MGFPEKQVTVQGDLSLVIVLHFTVTAPSLIAICQCRGLFRLPV
jgi:hypothetical protein